MCKYTFRKANFMHPNLKGYWVTLYLITDGKNTFTMYDQDSWLDNMHLISESQHCQSFTKDILVTPTDFSDIYEEISAFCHVLESNSN